MTTNGKPKYRKTMIATPRSNKYTSTTTTVGPTTTTHTHTHGTQRNRTRTLIVVAVVSVISKVGEYYYMACACAQLDYKSSEETN